MDATLDAAADSEGSFPVDALACAAPSVACGTECVDTRYDPANCGACGRTCPGGQLCSAGVCGVVCLGGTIQCGTLCVDERDDPSNCGGCGVRCGPSGSCVNGGCTSPAAEGGLVCAPPEAACGGQCLDTTSDPRNCGGCLITCRADQACEASQCVCPTGTLDCSSKCTDTTTDPDNCGACGAGCLVREVCSNSECVCAPKATSCNGKCVDTSIDMGNCGGCGVLCPAGSVCTDGQCAAPTSDWPMFGYSPVHDGVNPTETGKPPAIDQWAAQIVLTATALHPAAVENGRAFVGYAGGFNATSPLVAVNVADGSPLWSYNFGSVESVGHASAVGGKVYVQTNHGTSGNSYLWALDEATGNVLWASSFASQWENFWAPLVVGGVVYIDGGEYGGLYAFTVSDGTQLFFQSSVGQYDSWSPAFWNGSVFTFIGGNSVATFTAWDPGTGNLQ